MIRLAFSIASLSLLTACSTVDTVSDENRALSFKCDETVVIGKLENEACYERVPIEGDLIGHGWMKATLNVQRTLHGNKLSGDVPVRYFAHTYIREDRNFMFVLRRDEAGYKIETGQLMSVKPRPLNDCR